MSKDEADLHTCRKPEGTCSTCERCGPTQLTVTSHSTLLPKVKVCTYCDGPELAGAIQRGKPSAA